MTKLSIPHVAVLTAFADLNPAVEADVATNKILCGIISRMKLAANHAKDVVDGLMAIGVTYRGKNGIHMESMIGEIDKAIGAVRENHAEYGITKPGVDKKRDVPIAGLELRTLADQADSSADRHMLERGLSIGS